MRLNYKSGTGCAYGKECRFRHVEAEETPSKKSKKSGGKGTVALLKDSTQLGCVFHDSHPTKSILDEMTPSNSPRARGTTSKFGKQRVHREASFRSVNFMSVVLARHNSGNDHKRKPCTKKDAPPE